MGALAGLTRAGVVTVLLAALAAAPVAAGAPTGGWHRVTFPGRVTPDDRAMVEQLGGRAAQYAHPKAYVAWFATPPRPHDRATVTPVAAAEKIDPRVADASGIVRVEVIAHRSAANRIASSLRAHGVVHDTYAATASGELLSTLAEVPAGTVGTFAGDAAVLHVAQAAPGLQPEGEESGQVLAAALRNNREITGPGYRDFLAAHDLDGAGVTVSIVDTGVDDGHPDLDGRLVDRIHYSRLPTGDPWDVGGHGTHVAGIAVGGAGALPVLGVPTSAEGLTYGLGIAPAAGYLDQPAISRTRQGLPPVGGFERITGDAVSRGAVAWNASWTDGGGASAGYVNNARIMDALVRDADFSTDGNQPFTLVFSAGNSGADGLTSPKEAKNIITVGSSLSPFAGNVNTISSWSSRGPTRDGRVAPTVVAPGEAVAAARSRLPAESCNVIDTGTLRPLPADGYGMIALCSGTSMAAPQVTGSVALIHQWWRRQFADADPSPAMVKALLVNTATPLREIPSPLEGWGRVNLRALFAPEAQRYYLDQAMVFTAPGQEHTVTVDVTEPGTPLRVTLAWTDAPALWGADVALVNDLDLEVVAPNGTVYRGNNFELSASLPDGDPDRVNNVENVFLTSGTGTYRVTVRAHDVPGEGVPGGGLTSQDFALVVDGARAQ